MTPVVDISEETSPEAAASSGVPNSVTPTPIEDSVKDEVDLSPDENLEVEDYYSASAGSLDNERWLTKLLVHITCLLTKLTFSNIFSLSRSFPDKSASS
jgi:hypothetical protein